MMARARRTSRADEKLIAALARRRIRVTPRQLERWRQAGILQPPMRHGLGRGPGSASSYPDAAIEQAAVLAGLVRRGQPLGDVALVLFARRRWCQEDAVIAGYRGCLARMEAEALGNASAEDPLEVAEALAMSLLGTERRAGILKDLRSGARRARHAQATSRATTLARDRGRTNPNRADLATARADSTSTDGLLTSALTNLLMVMLSGRPSSDDALEEFLRVSGYAPPDAASGLLPTLAELSLPSLSRLLDDLTFDELELARDRILERSEHTGDLALALRSLGAAAVHRWRLERARAARHGGSQRPALVGG
jgi:hypothetical protein